MPNARSIYVYTSRSVLWDVTTYIRTISHPEDGLACRVILITRTNMHGAKSNLQTNMFAVVTISLSVIYQDHTMTRKAIRQPFNAQVQVQAQASVR